MLFLATAAVHVSFGIAAAATGAGAMWARKAVGAHPRWGATYLWLMGGVVLTAFVLMAILPCENFPAFVVSLAAIPSAFVGRRARRRGREGSMRVHAAGMGLSYVLLVTAFSVEAQTPPWNMVPDGPFWVFPSLIGMPLIARSLTQHALLRRSTTADDEGRRMPPSS